MPNPNRNFDKSDLTVEHYEERLIIHRDIIAHSFRWSHIVKFLMQGKRYASEILLDIGCGRDLPLPRLLYANRMTDSAYIGVDINRLEVPEMLKVAVANGKVDMQLIGERDAGTLTSDDLDFDPPTIVTSFEMFEHSHPWFVRRLLDNLHTITSPKADYFFSTPCYNGSAAANHINEMSWYTLGCLLEEAGYTIVNNYGTFASQSDIRPQVDKLWPGLFEKLNQYYDSNVMAIMYAPLFPRYSRNAMWHCRKRKEGDERLFPMTYPLHAQHQDIMTAFTRERPEGLREFGK